MEKINLLMCLILILLIAFTRGNATPVLHGRYTRDIGSYELTVPRKLTEDGNFLTFSTEHYFKHNERRKRNVEDDGRPEVHYGINFMGAQHHMELYPNHNLIAPDAVIEFRNPKMKVADVNLKKIADKRLCQFTGKLRGLDDSRVAISTCDGLAGYITLKGERYYIEPLEDHQANKRGQLLHMIYQRPENIKDSPRCGTDNNWTDAWKRRFRESLNSTNYDESPPRKRGLGSVHRYLETLIVADKKFLEHHKGSDYELYILTIMNMVSDYYHDSSVGNQMDVVVVRVMFLEKEEEEIDLAISQDAEKTLESFCKWQQVVNPKDIKSPNHHDIAVLLTRYDICSDNLENCGLMGLAYVAAACTADKPCAINEDGGLILGIVVAHEIGHVMGCSHDQEDVSGCKPQSDDESYYVMSPYVHLHTNIWSTCSKTFITTFFDNDLGECLNDEPDQSLYPVNNMLPGTVYDAKYQCQLHFPGSAVCSADPEVFCERLLCRTSPTACKSNGEPPADGTKCGENKWCYNKKCIPIGERPEAVNGGWGEWGAFSTCSRSCGSGVAISSRECNNPIPQHSGRFCLGDRKKVKLCNTQPCPEGAPSYRAIQCASYDSTPFQEKLYKWKPYLKEDDMCSLYCLNSDNVYVKLAPRAKDGTRCKPGTKDMCISGVCRKVGCDYQLDSDVVEDVCGVCKGDGTECKLVDKTFQSSLGHGYVKVAVIFKGSRNIVVEELKPSENTIAISGPDEKHYYLNGEFSEQSDGVRDIGGVEGVYSHPEPNKELLVIHGPLKENIALFVVFYKDENVGYRYKYAEPSTKSNYQPIYHWENIDWEPCTARCGGGVEISQPKCIEEKNGLVSSSFCPVAQKPPPQTRTCNEHPCRTKWRVSKWGKCMSCKNVSGIRMREVECVREATKPGEEDTLMENDQCKEKKPATKELCQAHNPCAGLKRDENSLPRDMMKKVWLQTVGSGHLLNQKHVNHLIPVRNIRTANREIRKILRRETDMCSVEGLEPQKPKLNVGSIVKDPIDKESIQLIEVPIKQSHTNLNISDETFQDVGGMPDTLDFVNAKTYKGDEAIKLENEILHANQSTAERSSSTTT